MATVSEIITAARQRLDDLADTAPSAWIADDSDMGWGNEELVDFLNEAIVEYCRRVPTAIVDSTTATDGGTPDLPLCSITLAASTPTYSISPLILRVEHVVLASEVAAKRTGRLIKVDRNEALLLRNETDVKYYQLDNYQNSITFIATPAAADTASLVVHRLPLATYTWASDQASVPEIRPRDHMKLVHWIEYLARLKRDPDTEQQGLADRAARRFTDAVGPQRSAKLEAVAREAADGPHRTVACY